jgi:hypothetical protein
MHLGFGTQVCPASQSVSIVHDLVAWLEQTRDGPQAATHCMLTFVPVDLTLTCPDTIVASSAAAENTSSAAYGTLVRAGWEIVFKFGTTGRSFPF